MPTLTTTVTPTTIATALGISAPTDGSTTDLQYEMWIADALMLIQARVDATDPEPTIDQDVLDYVIREAVTAHVRRPDDATQVTTSVDDGTVSKTYRSSAGRLTILGEWWAMLGLTTSSGRAFMVDLMPQGAGWPPDTEATSYWWWS